MPLKLPEVEGPLSERRGVDTSDQQPPERGRDVGEDTAEAGVRAHERHPARLMAITTASVFRRRRHPPRRRCCCYHRAAAAAAAAAAAIGRRQRREALRQVIPPATAAPAAARRAARASRAEGSINSE